MQILPPVHSIESKNSSFHQRFCSSCLFVSAGMVCCVRGVEPANCHLAQCRGGGGCGWAEGAAAAAEWRLLQTGHPAGGPAERPASSAGLPQHLARGETPEASCPAPLQLYTFTPLGPTVFEQWHRFVCGGFAIIKTVLPPAVPAVGRSAGHALCWRGSGWRSVNTAKPETAGGEAPECRWVLLLFAFAVNNNFL